VKKKKTDGTEQKSCPSIFDGNLDKIDDQIYVVHYSSLKKIKMDHPDKPEANKDLQKIWIYGDTGTCKSRALYMKFPDAYRNNCSKWWVGYTG
jgi:hypothetical protein